MAPGQGTAAMHLRSAAYGVHVDQFEVGFGETQVTSRKARSPARPTSLRKESPLAAPPNQLWQTDFTYLKVIGEAGGQLAR